MNKLKQLSFFILTCFAISAQAAPLQFQSVRIPEAPPGAKVMAAYFVIVNPGSKARTVSHIDSPEFEKVEIHSTVITDGIAKMQPLKNLTIPANGKLTLEPGGTHLMLIKPKAKLLDSDIVMLKITEKDGTEHALAAPVKKITTKHHHHHHHE